MLQGFMEMSSLVERGVTVAMHSAPVHIENIIKDMKLEGTEHEDNLQTSINWMNKFIKLGKEMESEPCLHECEKDDCVNWFCFVSEILAVDTYLQKDVLGLDESTEKRDGKDLPESVRAMALCTDVIYRYHQINEEGRLIAEHITDTLVEAQTQGQVVN